MLITLRLDADKRSWKNKFWPAFAEPYMNSQRERHTKKRMIYYNIRYLHWFSKIWDFLSFYNNSLISVQEKDRIWQAIRSFSPFYCAVDPLSWAIYCILSLDLLWIWVAPQNNQRFFRSFKDECRWKKQKENGFFKNWDLETRLVTAFIAAWLFGCTAWWPVCIRSCCASITIVSGPDCTIMWRLL